MTNGQRFILGMLLAAVIIVFALAVWLGFSAYLTGESVNFQQTMDTIDLQTRATFTAEAHGG